MPDIDVPISEIPIPVDAAMGPPGLLTLKIPAKPAQVALVVRLVAQELISVGIIKTGASDAVSAP